MSNYERDLAKRTKKEAEQAIEEYKNSHYESLYDFIYFYVEGCTQYYDLQEEWDIYYSLLNDYEKWKEGSGEYRRYEISNIGRVRNLRTKREVKSYWDGKKKEVYYMIMTKSCSTVRVSVQSLMESWKKNENSKRERCPELEKQLRIKTLKIISMGNELKKLKELLSKEGEDE